jgi:hypothetical protein
LSEAAGRFLRYTGETESVALKREEDHCSSFVHYYHVLFRGANNAQSQSDCHTRNREYLGMPKKCQIEFHLGFQVVSTSTKALLIYELMF